MRRKIIAITRPAQLEDPFVKIIRTQGGMPLVFPLIKLHPLLACPLPEDLRPKLSKAQWLVFTSKNGVFFFMDALKKNGYSAKTLLAHCRFAAVGSATAKLLESLGWECWRPAHFSGKFLAENLPIQVGDRVFIPRALKGKSDLPQLLEKRGAVVTDYPIYDTLSANYSEKEFLDFLAQKPDVITFTSPSAAFSFKAHLDKFDLSTPKILFAAIGTTTAQAMRECKFSLDILPDVFTLDALAKEIAKVIS